MPQRHLGTAACAFAMLLIVPRAASAGIIEIIAEMSGPKMFGFSADCRLNLDGTWDSCKTPGSLGLKAAAEGFVGPRPSKVWLSFFGGYYFSADATVNRQDYERGEVKMFVFDPMLEFESKSWPTKCKDDPDTPERDDCGRLRLQIYHGAIGMSYNLLFGAGFPTFSNIGMKVRPIGIVYPIGKIKNWDIGADFSYDLRLYPQRFTAEDFGHIPLEPEGNGAEAVHAFVFGLRIKILPEGTQ
jgi:hypothetical protein